MTAEERDRSITAVIERLRFGDSDGDDHDIAAAELEQLRLDRDQHAGNASAVLQAQQERDVVIHELAGLKSALDELGKHVFGGGWLDHGTTCAAGYFDEVCNCGLSDWLKRFEKPLGIVLNGLPTDVGAKRE